MALKLSEGQKLAIETKNKNILVSAAAGSGKTFVLTQRVLSRIIEDKWNIDSFLIVTFTRDAANEMKERIRKSLEKKLNDEAENSAYGNDIIKHIEKQLTLINRANISTIDSFCSNVVRQNFHKTDLDLGYRNITQIDETLLKKQAVDEALETLLDEKDEDFMVFYNMYMEKNSDNVIVDMIFKLYEYADNSPYPEKWLNECVEQYNSADNFYDSIWGRVFAENIEKSINTAENYANRAMDCLRNYDEIPDVVSKLFIAVGDFQNALKTGSIGEVANQEIGFRVTISKKFDFLGDDIINVIKGYVSFGKDALNYAKSCASMSDEGVNFLFESIQPVVKGLVKAEKAFMLRYKELKLENQLAEFNDISHSCLNILRDDAGRTTETARAYQDKFKEIIIDEYQDSNYLQEEILTAVSKIERGENNIFMVGDVKQAIYKFRLTTPKIFMDKYDRYSDKNENEKLILLSENYRSRAVVLDACNLIFKQIMDSRIGNVEYTDDVALNPKADFPKPADGINISNSTELIVVDTINTDNGTAASDIDGKRGEAKSVAKRIYEMLYENPLYIYDKEERKYRPVKKKDIVILVRKRNNAGAFYEELNSIGISCIFEKSNPLFESTEVKNIISLLRLIDNPLQDIDVVNVLHCPIYGLSFDEITELRINNRKNSIYTVIKEAEEKSVGAKRFLSDLDYYREYAVNNSITDLINEIYGRSNYFNYVGILENGELRQSNLRLFKEKAMELEEVSPVDLHSFIEYIDTDLSDDVKANDKIGSAVPLSENEDAVRIMTIHKSKGLEFPVVFVSLLQEKINNGYRANYIFDRELGIGLKFIDQTNRIRYKTMPFDIILDKYNEDEMSETLRLLYVALTRAREKLIITGVTSTKQSTSAKNKFNVLNNFAGDKNILLPYDLRNMADSPLFWILSALKRIDLDKNNIIKQKWVCLENVDSLENLKAESAVNIIARLKNIENADTENKYGEIIKERLDYVYPHMAEAELPSKISITEIKRKINAENDSDMPKFSSIRRKPDFMKRGGKITAAQKGTIYHTIMEHINFREETDPEKLIDKLTDMGILSREEKNAVNIDKISEFISSELFSRIKNASRIYKEAPFVMSVKASRLKEYKNAEGSLVVHGIIDLYFEEEDELVLVDYKTDRIIKNTDELRDKYKIQLELYKEALEKNTGKRVKECLIYSIDWGETINV